MAHPRLVLPILGSLLLSCTVQDGTPRQCTDDLAPVLHIGTGEDEFIPLTGDPPDIELVHGPQGGYHLVMAFQTKNLDSVHFITARMRGLVDGEVLAETERWQDFDCNRKTNLLEASNAYLIYDALPEELVGKLTTIEATLTDIDGLTASTTIVLRIVDEITE